MLDAEFCTDLSNSKQLLLSISSLSSNRFTSFSTCILGILEISKYRQSIGVLAEFYYKWLHYKWLQNRTTDGCNMLLKAKTLAKAPRFWHLLTPIRVAHSASKYKHLDSKPTMSGAVPQPWLMVLTATCTILTEHRDRRSSRHRVGHSHNCPAGSHWTESLSQT